MKGGKIFILVVILMMLSSVTAVVFYDQGTGIVNSTGSELLTGNLTILIYDAQIGGTLIYSKINNNSIINGSWNVKIESDLEYGKNYYKDYLINDDNMNFSGIDRIEFQSPYGYINNESFFNFSLIGECPVGSSIRQVFENGSVVCEIDDSGSGSVDLSDYSLTNESEIFIGNITTSETGFFGWLGSFTNRITKIFAEDLSLSGNLEVGGNISGNIVIDGNLTPAINNTYSLGSLDFQWKDLYVSSNTIYIEGIPLSSNGNELLWNNVALSSFNVWKENVSGNIAWTEPASKVGIGTSNPLTKLDVRGNITADSYFGDGSHLTGIVNSTLGENATLIGNVTIGGNLNISGNVTTESVLFRDGNSKIFVKGGELYIEY